MSDSLIEPFGTPSTTHPRINVAKVLCNVTLCREHARLTLNIDEFPPAAPGQFIQLSPVGDCPVGCAASHGQSAPLLPRAFSIGGLRRAATGCEIDVLYRVVGVATRWMHTLQPGDRATVLGPLGREFPIVDDKHNALLIIGGVGLPPLLYLAERLQQAGKRTVAILGARTRDLIPLSLVDETPPAADASCAVHCAEEFARYDDPMVISTDDGSIGFSGNVMSALSAYARANTPAADNTVVYTCGPERMMRATADFCQAAGMTCFVCLERTMACGMGTCQSCIVTVRTDQPATGTRYALCCTEGPVFDAEHIVWDDSA